MHPVAHRFTIAPSILHEREVRLGEQVQIHPVATADGIDRGAAVLR
jgi:hypothetical protein